MTTSPAYDALVARKLREREVKIKCVPIIEFTGAELDFMAATVLKPKRKGGWPKGKKRGPKAGK